MKSVIETHSSSELGGNELELIVSVMNDLLVESSESIQRSNRARIFSGELLHDSVHVVLAAERQIMDRVSQIHLFSHHHQDLIVSMSGDMEVSWNSVHLDVTSVRTPFFLFECFSSKLNEVLDTPSLLSGPDSELISESINSVLSNFVSHINDMSSHLVLNIKGENMARSLSEANIHVDCNLIISLVELLDLEDGVDSRSKEIVDLSEENSDDGECAADRDQHASCTAIGHASRQALKEVHRFEAHD